MPEKSAGAINNHQKKRSLRLGTYSPRRYMGDIKKAILKNDLGLPPNNDGKVIRVPIPPLTEERRRELVKHVKKIAEKFRVSVRNHRRVAVEQLKEAEKKKEINSDESKHVQ
jgi:ribosome recycling factor